MSFIKSKRTALLVSLTAVLLAVLAVLQYRWVADLSEFEQDQARRNLDLATRGFTRDLGGEFRRVRTAFRFRGGRNLEQQFHEEYQEWSEASAYPDLILDAYWIDYEPPEPGESGPGSQTPALRIRKAALRDIVLGPADWPSALAPIRERLLAAAASRGRSRSTGEWLVSLEPERLAYVVPQDDRGPSGWSVMILDRGVLFDQAVPSLVEEYFGPASERDYLVRILDTDPEDPREDATLLYASDPDRFGGGGATVDIQRNINDEGANWVVEARHRDGSIEAFVGWHRWRNLSLGFGAVGVLGASFSVLLIAARRAHWLADRQMEFVAGVSHELRTPIAGISSLSQNLADGVVRDLEQAARYGESINAESRRLNEMVEKVLHFSAIRSGQYRYELQPVDVTDIVEPELEAVERCSDTAPRVEAAFAEDLPRVMGDAQALRSLVRNLVSNAVKFGRGKVSLVARPVERRGRREIELSVEDRGAGIPDADLAHVFEPFYRGDAARASQIGGSGLGLSLVREIVSAHRGRVEVDTREGEGTRFRVYLPAAEEGDSGESPA